MRHISFLLATVLLSSQAFAYFDWVHSDYDYRYKCAELTPDQYIIRYVNDRVCEQQQQTRPVYRWVVHPDWSSQPTCEVHIPGPNGGFIRNLGPNGPCPR